MENNLIRSQIYESCKLSLPEGLKDLMSDISREVLRAQPQNVYQFIANYLEALLEVREALSIACHICDDTCKCACGPELHSELKEIGLDEDNLNKVVEIIGAHLKNDSVNEPSLFVKLVSKASIDEFYIPAIQGAVQRAFKRRQLKNTKFKYSQNDRNDETTNSVKHTIQLYQRSEPKNKQVLVSTNYIYQEPKYHTAGDFEEAYFQEQDRYLELVTNNDVVKDNTKKITYDDDNYLENVQNYDSYDTEDFNEDIEEEIPEHGSSKKTSIASSVGESLTNGDESDDEIM